MLGSGNSASGTLQVGAERVALKHVFAVLEADMLAGGDKEKLTVLLSDLPVPDELRKATDDWRYWAEKQARAGALHGVIVTIDPATAAWNRGDVLTRQGLMFYTETVTSRGTSSFCFEPAAPLGEQVAGKVWMTEPMSGVFEEEGPWRVEAEFRTQVLRRAAVTAVLTGAEAQSSPQYKAVTTFLEACRKKDLDAIRNSVDPNSSEALEQMIAGGEEEAIEILAAMAAESLTLELIQVTVRGDSAEVELADTKPDSETRQVLRVVPSDGEWKLAQ
jgi:hypothetical protein